MSKRKTIGKEKKKASQFVIRVDKTERDAFVKLCDELDTSAAREIRRFMREMVATHPGKAVEPAAETPDAETPDAEAADGAGLQQDDEVVKASEDQVVVQLLAQNTRKSKRKPK